MFDFAWSEVALIAVVALVVIGPKDLPRVLRSVGKWVRQARAIAREFQGSLEQMVREAELDEVKRDIEKVASVNLKQEIENTIDPKGEMQQALSDTALTDPLATPKDGAAPIVAAEPTGTEPAALPAPAEAEAQPAPPEETVPAASPAEPVPAEPTSAEPVRTEPIPAKSGAHA